METAEPASSQQSVGVPWRSPVVITVLAATLMTPMDVPLISSALPEIRSAFGVSATRAGLFITLYAVPGILLGPFVGAMADRFGRRDVLAGCLVVFGGAGAAIGFTDSFAVALGLRVLQGVAAGSVLSALAMTVVGDRYAGRQHDAVMGVTAATLSLGTAVYPFLGGYLASRSWNAPFLLYGLAVPVAGLVWYTLDGRGSTREPGAGRGFRSLLRRFPTRRAVSLYGIMFVSFTLLFGGLYTALPFYLAGAFGFSPTTVGLVTSAVLLATAVVSTQNGALSARASTTALLTSGFALYALAFLGVALAGAPPLLLGSLLVFGVGNGLVTPTLFGTLSGLAPDDVRAGVMGLQTTTIGGSQAVGPAAFTLLGGVVGYQGSLLAGSVAAAVAAALLGVLPLEE